MLRSFLRQETGLIACHASLHLVPCCLLSSVLFGSCQDPEAFIAIFHGYGAILLAEQCVRFQIPTFELNGTFFWVDVLISM